MVFDEVRNAAYARALEGAIQPGMTVLDLGAGLGIHGLMAARLGADMAYLVDPSPLVLQVSELSRLNDVADRIKIIRDRIETADIPEPVDIVVSVLTGNFLLTEDLLPMLFTARDRFLKPGGTLIPDQARMHVALVSAPDLYEERITRWSEPTLGVRFDPICKLAANMVHYVRADAIETQQLSAAATLATMDFMTADRAEVKSRVVVTVRKSGICHGLLGWFDMQLGDEWVSTGPDAELMHWSLAFLPLDPPMEISKGEQVEIELNRPEFGEWTWTVNCGDRRQRQSTFHSHMAEMDFLKSQLPGFIPGLGEDGKLALFVLEAMDDGKSTAEILSASQIAFDSFYNNTAQLDRTVRRLIAKWKKRAA